MPRGILLIARSAMLLGIATLTALLSADRANAADRFKVGDKVRPDHSWFTFHDNDEKEWHPVDRGEGTWPAKVEHVRSSYIMITVGTKRGWARAEDFELADGDEGSLPQLNSLTSASGFDTDWLPPTSVHPSVAENASTTSSAVASRNSTSTIHSRTNTVPLPSLQIVVGGKIMPRELTVPLMYRAQRAAKTKTRAQSNDRTSRNRQTSAATKTVCTAADIDWPVTAREIKGDWVWIDEPRDERSRGWVRRTDVMALDDAPFYYTAKIAEAIADGQQTANWYFLRACCRIGQDRVSAAIADFLSAHHANPGVGEMLVNRAQALCMAECYPVALKHVRGAEELGATSLLTLRLNGYLQLKQRDRSAAIEALNRAVELEPQRANNYYYRSQARMLREAEPELALADIEKAIAIENNSDYVCQQVQVLIRLGRYERAIAELARGIRRDPLCQGLRLLQIATFGISKRSLSDIDTTGMSGKARVLLTVLRFQDAINNKQTQTLRSELSSALKTNLPASEKNGLRAMLAMAYGIEGDIASMQAEFDALIAEDPRNPEWYYMRGRMSLCASNFRAAIRDTDEAIALAADQPKSIYHQLHAHALLEIGDLGGAVLELQTARQISPKSSGLLFDSARILLALKRPREAIVQCDLALEQQRFESALDSSARPPVTTSGTSNSNPFEAWVNGLSARFEPDETPDHLASTLAVRSYAHFALGEFAKARADYEAALREAPDRKDALIAKVDFLARCPDPALRDPSAAIAAAYQACRECKLRTNNELQALAAAHAAADQFAVACYWQEFALWNVSPIHRAEAEDRLACYRQQRIATPVELVVMREARDGTERH